MTNPEVLVYRRAGADDVFRIMELYQRAQPHLVSDFIYLEYNRLAALLNDPNNIWMLAEMGNKLIASISLRLDPDQRIGKVYRMLISGQTTDTAEVLRRTLVFTIRWLKEKFPDLDLLYTTTLSLKEEQQEIARNVGFKTLGIFPNAHGEDRSHLNSLTGFYYPGTLEAKRAGNISLHPELQKLFQITSKECGLAPLPVAKLQPPTQGTSSFSMIEVQELELITAVGFVKNRFLKLKESRTIDTFYPFQIPNLILCDENEDVQIFVRLDHENRFASIIGEHVKKSLDPVRLYSMVREKLKTVGASYTEVINDAGDSEGNGIFLRAGFTPCAYFPCLKRHGESRRDYVVFGHSSEYVYRPHLNTLPIYLDYYSAYAQIEFGRYGLVQPERN
ncbi:MAG: hypothetical protein K2X47_19400 [Bdellovibrionales bacterium]|nr:hypothetical protein [Bdellovibrionales bacterium]